MAKTRAQPFGNFDTSGALAGIRATVEGAQFEAALKQRSWENLLGTVERTVTGVANRKLAREEMANREEEWRTKLAAAQDQFAQELSERRSERADAQAWREKMFQYGADRDAVSDQESALDRLDRIAQAQRLERMAEANRSLELSGQGMQEIQGILGTAGQAVTEGRMDSMAFRQLVASLQPRYQGLVAAHRSRLMEMGASEGEAMGTGLPLEVLSEVFSAQARAMMEQAAPEVVIRQDEEFQKAQERLLELQSIHPSRMTNQQRVELARLSVRVPEYEAKQRTTMVGALRQRAKELIGERFVNEVEDVEDRRLAGQIALGYIEQLDVVEPKEINALVGRAREEIAKALSQRREKVEEGGKDREWQARVNEAAEADAEIKTEEWWAQRVAASQAPSRPGVPPPPPPTQEEKFQHYARLLRANPNYMPERSPDEAKEP